MNACLCWIEPGTRLHGWAARALSVSSMNDKFDIRRHSIMRVWNHKGNPVTKQVELKVESEMRSSSSGLHLFCLYPLRFYL